MMYIGRYGTGKWNNSGDTMAAMAETNELFSGSTMFQKKAGQRWTWIALNARSKNEHRCI